MDSLCSKSRPTGCPRAYSVAIRLLPQLAWIGLSLAHPYHGLIQAADVVREAAAAALDLGRPETAVEWIEQGRSIVWSEMFQLRSSYDKFSSAYPDHARKLRELPATLERAMPPAKHSCPHHWDKFLAQSIPEWTPSKEWPTDTTHLQLSAINSYMTFGNC